MAPSAIARPARAEQGGDVDPLGLTYRPSLTFFLAARYETRASRAVRWTPRRSAAAFLWRLDQKSPAASSRSMSRCSSRHARYQDFSLRKPPRVSMRSSCSNDRGVGSGSPSVTEQRGYANHSASRRPSPPARQSRSPLRVSAGTAARPLTRRHRTTCPSRFGAVAGAATMLPIAGTRTMRRIAAPVVRGPSTPLLTRRISLRVRGGRRPL